MPAHYTAADLLAVARGERTLHRAAAISSRPLPKPERKPAVIAVVPTLPAPRRRNLTARDILEISRHSQPWRALSAPEALRDAG